MSNRLSRRDLVAESFSAGLDELYKYDLINRLNDLNRGTLNSTATAINPASGTFNQCWSLDTTGNWSGLREDNTGDGIWDLIQSRTANPVNEITGITNTVGSTWVQPAYDTAGNMTTVPQPADPTSAFTCTYDAWNRLVKAVDASTGNTVAHYSYDGAKRRTIKVTYTAGVLSETRHFIYTDPSRWQVVEERVGTFTSAERQFVWGLRYIDDLVMRDRDTTGSGTLNERFYGLQDPNWNMVAIVDSAATVNDRYNYDAYGTVTVRTPSFASGLNAFDWDYLYAGYRRDGEVALYDVRDRVLHPLLGWLQRDPEGLAQSASLYSYIDNRPVVAIDPSGTQFFCFVPGWGMVLCGAILVVSGGAAYFWWPSPPDPRIQEARDAWNGGSPDNCRFDDRFNCGLDQCLAPCVRQIWKQAGLNIIGNSIDQFKRGKGDFDLRCDANSKQDAVAATGPLPPASGGAWGSKPQGWTRIPTNKDFNSCGDVAMMLMGELQRQGRITMETPNGNGSIDQNLSDMKSLQACLCKLNNQDCKPTGSWFHPERPKVIFNGCDPPVGIK
jgi:RHS repeat-associated protein